MTPFAYQRAGSPADAVKAFRQGNAYLAGGTDLVDLLKQGVESPERLIDLGRARLDRFEDLANGGLRLGAGVHLAQLGRHAGVRARWPGLTQAVQAGATPQLRNAATLAGAVLQRTRCFYFREPGFACNKRHPGTGCSAVAGVNKAHAILGATEHCIAVHPSDVAVALVALDANVRLLGPAGERTVPAQDLLRLTGEDPTSETLLAPGELVLSFDLPVTARAARSTYVKTPAGGFALASVAVAVELGGGRVRSARVALGGVAHKPWRAEGAEAVLTGAAPGERVIRAAADAALEGARDWGHNGFKIPLAREVLRQALTRACEAGGAP